MGAQVILTQLTNCQISLNPSLNRTTDFVILGMGAVKQEEAAIALVNSGFTGRVYTCGGFVHQNCDVRRTILPRVD